MCMSSDRGEQAESDTGGQLIDDDLPRRAGVSTDGRRRPGSRIGPRRAVNAIVTSSSRALRVQPRPPTCSSASTTMWAARHRSPLRNALRGTPLLIRMQHRTRRRCRSACGEQLIAASRPLPRERSSQI